MMKIIIKKDALVKKPNVLKNIVNAIIQELNVPIFVNVKIVKMDPKYLLALTIRIIHFLIFLKQARHPIIILIIIQVKPLKSNNKLN